jgi:hypothetical protein
MKNLSFFLLALLCLSAKAQNNEKYFEGMITYKVTSIALDPKIDQKAMDAFYGDSMSYIFKAGHIKKEYFYRSAKKQTRIYDPVTTLNSKFTPDNDTLYQYHASKNGFFTIDYKPLPDTIIDQKKLTGIGLVVCDKLHPKVILSYKYYFEPSLKINHEWFKNYNEAEWNRIMKEKKSLSCFFSIETPGKFINYYKAVKVEPKTIQDAEFQLPSYPVKNID